MLEIVAIVSLIIVPMMLGVAGLLAFKDIFGGPSRKWPTGEELWNDPEVRKSIEEFNKSCT